MTSSRFHSGDILAFYGTSFESRAIEFVTGRPSLRYPFWRNAPSHVAIIAGHPDDVAFERGRAPMLVWESTSLCTLPDMMTGKPKVGVQVHPIQERVDSYDGPVYQIPLMPSWRLDYHEWSLLTRFLNHHHSEGYDTLEAVLCATRGFKFLRNRFPDPRAVFCSELCATALMRVNRLPVSNSSMFNPADLVQAIRSAGTHGPMVLVKRSAAR